MPDELMYEKWLAFPPKELNGAIDKQTDKQTDRV